MCSSVALHPHLLRSFAIASLLRRSTDIQLFIKRTCSPSSSPTFCTYTEHTEHQTPHIKHWSLAVHPLLNTFTFTIPLACRCRRTRGPTMPCGHTCMRWRNPQPHILILGSLVSYTLHAQLPRQLDQPKRKVIHRRDWCWLRVRNSHDHDPHFLQ